MQMREEGEKKRTIKTTLRSKKRGIESEVSGSRYYYDFSPSILIHLFRLPAQRCEFKWRQKKLVNGRWGNKASVKFAQKLKFGK